MMRIMATCSKSLTARARANLRSISHMRDSSPLFSFKQRINKLSFALVKSLIVKLQPKPKAEARS